MASIESIHLETLAWQPGRRGRLWYIQPRFEVEAHHAPFLSTPSDGELTCLELLRIVCDHDRAHFPAPEAAPTLILLPEFAIPCTEIPEVQDLIVNARPNTLFVLGLGHISDEQARAMEPEAQLWEGAADGRFTNCALIGVGGSHRLFLQPKILPSRWEQDIHWPGAVVRHFVGEYVQFIVLICSELLGRPEGVTTIADVTNELRRRGLALNLLIWLQYNRDPRSQEFNQSIAQLEYHQPTVLVVSSRNDRSARLRNFAVSGALVPAEVLPRRFRDLDKRFRYVEPVMDQGVMSRLVLLRYDAPVYRVETVLADAVRADGGVERGEIFQQSQPYIVQGSTLQASDDAVHLVDVTRRARDRAVADAAALQAGIDRIRDALVDLGTSQFLSWLDVAILPQPRSPALRHAAGQQHRDRDTSCRCWDHRVCIDRVADDPDAVLPLTEVLIAAAALDSQTGGMVPRYDEDRRTNFVARIDETILPLGIVYPFNFDGDEVRRGICGSESEITLINSAYIILGTGDARTRPSVTVIDAGRPLPLGGLRAGIAAVTLPRAIYWREFWASVEGGTCATLLRERFLQ